MSETITEVPQTPPSAVAPDEVDTSARPATTGGWVRAVLAALCLATAGAGWLAWNTQKRVDALSRELVKRQGESQTQSTEALILSKQSQDLAREAAARTTLLETRLAEVALQRTQVEELIKTLNLSRDENLVADIEASLRVASQQAALTGSAEPLVAALQSADDRLSRAHQPRLDNIRRAVARDLDRIRATRVTDLNALTIRLDEAARLVDEVPLLNQPEATVSAGSIDHGPARASSSRASRQGRASASSASSADATDKPSWHSHVLDWTKGAAQTMWDETQGLIRLTRINRPEGMLISPEQGFFLRENIKLRLLNARLALLSRQTPVAQADLQNIQATIPRYFDTASRKTQLLQSMLSEVNAQTLQTTVPRPDDTLAALTAVSGGH